MGCTISKFHSRIADLSKRRQSVSTSSAITLNAYSLHTFLNSDNPNPKCIFIFGKDTTLDDICLVAIPCPD